MDNLDRRAKSGGKNRSSRVWSAGRNPLLGLVGKGAPGRLAGRSLPVQEWLEGKGFRPRIRAATDSDRRSRLEVGLYVKLDVGIIDRRGAGAVVCVRGGQYDSSVGGGGIFPDLYVALAGGDDGWPEEALNDVQKE
jgi:hypothetical protein